MTAVNKSFASENIPGWKYLKPFVVGGTAGCMATMIVTPIDIVKVRLQLIDNPAQRKPFAVARNILVTDGPLGFYRGLSAGLLRQLTYGTSRLGIFKSLTNHFSDNGKKKMDFSTTAMCSLIAGASGALIGTPADAALVRMQADTMLPMDQRRNYKNGVDAMIRMFREEGLRGFFSGAGPTIVRGVVLNFGMLASYDECKKAIEPYLGVNTQAANGVAGFMSGIIAATMCLPFDNIKTKMQKMQKLPDGSYPYKSTLDAFSKVIKTQGFSSLYAGYPTFVVRIAPHIGLTWLFMEFFNSL